MSPRIPANHSDWLTTDAISGSDSCYITVWESGHERKRKIMKSKLSIKNCELRGRTRNSFVCQHYRINQNRSMGNYFVDGKTFTHPKPHIMILSAGHASVCIDDLEVFGVFALFVVAGAGLEGIFLVVLGD